MNNYPLHLLQTELTKLESEKQWLTESDITIARKGARESYMRELEQQIGEVKKAIEILQKHNEAKKNKDFFLNEIE